MSRLIRIILFTLIVLLLIFFGFRCSQTLPQNSKTHANPSEHEKPTTGTLASITSSSNSKTEQDHAEIKMNLPPTLTETTITSEAAVESTNDINDTTITSPETENMSTVSTENTNDTNTANPEAVNTSKTASETNNNETTTSTDNTKTTVEAPSPTTTADTPQPSTEQTTSNNDSETNNKIDTSTITTGASIVLKGVSFASGSDVLIKSSIATLNDVAKTLTEKPELQIEIAGYTDNRGSHAINTKLSQHRADKVKNYLISQNIDAKRLSAKGYGSSSPIASNRTKAGREQNRRVEIHVR